ncbi:MAG: DUF6461 domain-containing protein [Nakamurella sp.]
MGNTTGASTTGVPSPEVVATVAGLIPLLVQHIPLEPAAILGRLSAGDDGELRSWPHQHPQFVQHRAVVRGPRQSAVMASLRSVDPLLAERLLGSLELTVGTLRGEIPDGLIDPPPAASGSFAITTTRGAESDTSRAVSQLDAVHPQVLDAALALAVALAADDAIRPLLVIDSSADPDALWDEQEIAGRHGARYLALGVATAAVVLSALRPWLDSAPATIGTGIGTASALLTEAALPAAYADAQLAKQRREYLIPRMATGSAVVNAHRFAVVESPTEANPNFAGNGLVDVVPGGIVIRTGIEQGQPTCQLNVVAGEPPLDGSGWDEVVDISWTAARGGATAPGFRDRTPPWPGSYRTRVCADGRDRGEERYQLTVWAAPAAPTLVHKASDKIGAALRGESAVAAEPSEARYRWLTKSVLSEAATVTVVTRSTPDEVLRAFGADPGEATSLSNRLQQFGIDPWVAVLAVDNTAIAVEVNGWQGAQPPVLRELSKNGRAASMYWSVNNNGTVSIAAAGEVLGSGGLGMQHEDSPELDAALAGLDLDDYRDTVAKGQLAVERFTGFVVRQEHLDALLAVDRAYPILPQLPELYSQERLPDGTLRWPARGPLAPIMDTLLTMTDDRLGELAWWIAGETATATGLGAHPAVLESIAAGALSRDAQLLARRSELEGHEQHRQLWMTLHAATNPDRLAALLGTAEAAQHAGLSSTELLSSFRARID